MSKKKISKQKAGQKKQQARQAKKNRQKHDPVKWEEKKIKKQIVQQNKCDSTYQSVHPKCKLGSSTPRSRFNCMGCNLLCDYNPSFKK